VADSATLTPKAATLDFLLSYTECVPAEQVDASKNCDSKAVQIFAGATVIVGLAAAGVRGGSAELIGAAIGVYLIVAVAVAAILWPRGFRLARPVDQLYEEHWDQDVPDIKHALLARLSADYQQNEAILGRKSVCLLVALVAATVEAILIGTSLIVSLA
jgi:hypothetical protein